MGGRLINQGGGGGGGGAPGGAGGVCLFIIKIAPLYRRIEAIVIFRFGHAQESGFNESIMEVLCW